MTGGRLNFQADWDRGREDAVSGEAVRSDCTTERAFNVDKLEPRLCLLVAPGSALVGGTTGEGVGL